MNSKEVMIALGSAVIGASATIGAVYLNIYAQKPEYEVTTNSCSEKGPEEVWIENLDTGDKRKIEGADIPAALDRVTNISNTGAKTITDADLHINIENPTKSQIMQELVFFESPLSKHKIIANDDGTVFRISLKDFNPKDKISIVTTSTRTLGISVIGKMNGLTINTRISRDQSCGWFSNMSYGGVIAYSKIDKDCEIPRDTLNLQCDKKYSIPTPKDFPPGRARLIFK
jgi:hypothetical protein